MNVCGPEGLALTGRSLHPGQAQGTVLVLDEPLSFWGGVNHTGTIVDAHHPQCGAALAGRVLAMPSGRGSSSSTAVLAELIRAGTAPAGILLAECDAILVIGALVAAEMYDVSMPVVQMHAEDLGRLRSGAHAAVLARTAPLDAIVKLENR